ncbi:hypothetical protein D6829_01940 [Candidatus Pacearchaeota archaeon]|nr:MAG: hypothetical protein D6829_01940 [Candidatus Pacearchaeota archaeon]
MKKSGAFLELLAIAFLFTIASLLVQQNIDFFEKNLSNRLGPLIYFILVVAAIVLAPFSAFPLIPVASKLWGPLKSSVLNILGWTIGAIIAFIIAKKFGKPIVKKLIPIKSVERIEKRIPKKRIFLSIVFLRMSVPVDVLSYALGLFSNVSFPTYLTATLIGIIPFGIIFSYAGSLDWKIQATAFLLAVILAATSVLKKSKQQTL